MDGVMGVYEEDNMNCITENERAELVKAIYVQAEDEIRKLNAQIYQPAEKIYVWIFWKRLSLYKKLI